MHLGYLSQPFSKNKQALHDMVEGTVVVCVDSQKHGPKGAWFYVGAIKLTFIWFVINIGLISMIFPDIFEQAKKTPTQTLTQQALKDYKPGAIFRDCDDCPEMVKIPAGSFMMGYDDRDSLALEDERPQQRVQVQSFAIGKYEVTQEEWIAVMGFNPSYSKGTKLPLENIFWGDVQDFVIRLSQKTGKNYRLPSEAEWEYVARGGSSALYPWGNDASELSNYAWFNKNSSSSTNPVGLKKPNQFGIYDMLGNVNEWTQDCWNENYIGAPADGSSWTTGECSRPIFRGGSCADSQSGLRTALRGAFDMKPMTNVGFRVARSN